MYYLLVTFIYASSSIIIITSLSDIMIKTIHQNKFTIDILGLASILMYNNSASPVSLICNLSHNVISPIDISNNSLSLNNHEIPFLWTSLRNFCHPLNLTLSWSQLTGLPSRQSLFLPMIPSCLWTQHICSFFMCSFSYHLQ